MTIITNFLARFWEQLTVLFTSLRVADYIDILIVAFVIYEVIVIVRHTRAQQLAYGILVLLLVYAIAVGANLRALSFLLDTVMKFGIVVLAVIFQPELRRALEQMGGVNSAFSRLFGADRNSRDVRSQWEKSIVAMCDAAENMAEERVGALMVLERNVNLNEIIRTGTMVHSDVSVEMLATIFYEGTPLHDGAVVVREGRIEAAGCFLPLSNNLEIGKDMGTRHRSALGMSENSDAIVIVVSEETGIISLAKNGVLIRRLDRQNLFNLLISEIVPPEEETKKKGFFGRLRKGEKNEEKK